MPEAAGVKGLAGKTGKSSALIGIMSTVNMKLLYLR